MKVPLILTAVIFSVATASAAEPAKALEPTNAAEAAAKKAAEDAATDTQYQALVATLPPDQQAWERVLEQNLGNGFYLPIHKRSRVKGQSTCWDFVQLAELDRRKPGRWRGLLSALIHVSGQVETEETLRDPVFGVEAVALQLKRHVEMYQWKEKKTTEKHTKLGGGEETTTRYEYTKDWSDELISSSSFSHPQDHSNPAAMPVSKLTLTASKAALGGYRVSSFWIGQMHGDEGLHLSDNVLAKISAEWKGKCKKEGETLYIGKDSNVPEVGDARITFQILRPGLFSILGEQSGPSLGPYATRAGGEIARVESGEVSAALMFQHAQRENTILTWVARVGGFILMWVGFSMMLGPLKVLADIIPFAGTIVGIGTAMIAAIISFVASLVIIAVAWLVVRPLLGGTLLLVAVAALILGIRHARQPSRQRRLVSQGAGQASATAPASFSRKAD